MPSTEFKGLRRSLRHAQREVDLLTAKADAVGSVNDDNLLAQAKRRRDSIVNKMNKIEPTIYIDDGRMQAMSSMLKVPE